jgi:hypothetical protein
MYRLAYALIGRRSIPNCCRAYALPHSPDSKKAPMIQRLCYRIYSDLNVKQSAPLHLGQSHLLDPIVRSLDGSFIYGAGVEPSPPSLRAIIGLLYQPWMIDDYCAASSGIMSGRGNWSTRSKPAPVRLCLPYVPHVLVRPRTRAVAMGSRQLTAWSTAR